MAVSPGISSIPKLPNVTTKTASPNPKSGSGMPGKSVPVPAGNVAPPGSTYYGQNINPGAVQSGGPTPSSIYGSQPKVQNYDWEYYAKLAQGMTPTQAKTPGGLSGAYPYWSLGGAGNNAGGTGSGGRSYLGPPVPSTPAPPTWSQFNYNAANAPSWWRAMAPSQITPETEFLATINMMIPYLSPEDQRAAAAMLYQQNPQNFNYLPATTSGTIPGAKDMEAEANYFQGAGRTQEALSALDALAKATGGGKTAQDFGPGYRYLQTLLSTEGRFAGGQGGMTRGQQLQYLGALDPLLAQSSSGDLSPYGPLAQYITQPFFSAGQLMPVSKDATGNYVFGGPLLQELR